MNAHEIMLAKGIAYRKTVSRLETAFTVLDITVADWLCLGVLSDGAKNGGKIAHVLGVSKGLASRTLHAQIVRGYVAESRSTEDDRIKQFELTPEGRDVLEAANIHARNTLKVWLTVVDEADIRTYIHTLLRVAEI